MATTFGVEKSKLTYIYDEGAIAIPTGIVNSICGKTDLLIIAYRYSAGRGKMGWMIIRKNLFGHLPDETPVYPIDNTAQGIHTIEDIKNLL